MSQTLQSFIQCKTMCTLFDQESRIRRWSIVFRDKSSSSRLSHVSSLSIHGNAGTSFWWHLDECLTWRQPARIREETLESGSLSSGSWIPPMYRFRNKHYEKLCLLYSLFVLIKKKSVWTWNNFLFSQITKCCAGFYSADCHACPGGFQNPCLGRGKVGVFQW